MRNAIVAGIVVVTGLVALIFLKPSTTASGVVDVTTPISIQEPAGAPVEIPSTAPAVSTAPAAEAPAVSASSAPPAASAVPAFSAAPGLTGSDARFTEAAKLASDGKLVEARQAWKALASEPLSSAQRQAADQGMIAVNKTLLFSEAPAPDAQVHTVEPGENLWAIAKQYKKEPDFIKVINKLSSNTIHIGQKLKVPTGTFSVRIEKHRHALALMYEGTVAREYAIACGKDNKTPEGSFEIASKLLTPDWTMTDPATGRKIVVPYGDPRNVLGVRWMGFNAPYASFGIHGTTAPESIGTDASEGCIRMLNKDVEELYSIIPHGTKIEILP